MKINIPYYILLLLHHNHAVRIPGLGRITRAMLPAAFTSDQQHILPPSASHQFTAKPGRKGTLLVDFLQYKTGISAGEAKEAVLTFSSDLLQQMRETGKAEVAGLGEFKRKRKGIHFIPDQRYVNSVYSRYLPVARPQLRTELPSQPEVRQEPTQAGKEEPAPATIAATVSQEAAAVTGTLQIADGASSEIVSEAQPAGIHASDELQSEDAPDFKTPDPAMEKTPDPKARDTADPMTEARETVDPATERTEHSVSGKTADTVSVFEKSAKREAAVRTTPTKRKFPLALPLLLGLFALTIGLAYFEYSSRGANPEAFNRVPVTDSSMHSREQEPGKNEMNIAPGTKDEPTDELLDDQSSEPNLLDNPNSSESKQERPATSDIATGDKEDGPGDSNGTKPDNNTPTDANATGSDHKIPPSSDCYIVVGAFGVHANVTRMEARLETLGYKSALVPRGRLTQVMVPVSCERTGLKDTLEQLRAEVEKDAWILKQ